MGVVCDRIFYDFEIKKKRIYMTRRLSSSSPSFIDCTTTNNNKIKNSNIRRLYGGGI